MYVSHQYYTARQGLLSPAAVLLPGPANTVSPIVHTVRGKGYMSDSASDSVDSSSSSGTEDGIDVEVSALSLEAAKDGNPHAYDKHIEVITKRLIS